jgi:hypothetical protein
MVDVTVAVYVMVAVWLVPSVMFARVPLTTVTLNVYVPAVVGVPERVAAALSDARLGRGQLRALGATPAMLVRDKPGGSAPDVMHHISGPGPPFAWIEVL